MDTFAKLDDQTLEVTKAPAEAQVVTYSISFLKSQREQILRDQERVAKELAEVDALLSETEKLGIVEAVSTVPVA